MNGPALVERRLSARGPWRVFLSRMVGQADIYVGIIGLRYGAVVRGRPELSYTELEFDEATALGLHRLIFIIREGAQPDLIVDQPDEQTARQADFRRRLLDAGLTTAWIRSTSELQTLLHQSLVELQSELQREANPPPQRLQTARELLHHTSDGAVHPHVDVAWLSDLWDRLDQPQIGDAISLLRQHADLTRAQLIERMCQVSEEQNPGLDMSLVYRWEKGEKGRPGPRPRPRYRRLLALVCEHELRLMSEPHRSELLRRLRALTASPVVAGPTVLDSGRRAFVGSPDGPLLDGMAALTRSYVLLHNTVAPLAVRTAIARHFEDLAALTLKSHAPSSSATIRSLAAQTAILGRVGVVQPAGPDPGLHVLERGPRPGPGGRQRQRAGPRAGLTEPAPLAHPPRSWRGRPGRGAGAAGPGGPAGRTLGVPGAAVVAAGQPCPAAGGGGPGGGELPGPGGVGALREPCGAGRRGRAVGLGRGAGGRVPGDLRDGAGSAG
ncbi:MAG: DUF4062 domain-containing protein [Chloroflexi bacterium]|nr:MAG: DUF4062 domain-containing protein [Chloroflexota bacterium]